MASFDLRSIARRQRNIRRKAIILRNPEPPAALASPLLAAYEAVMDAWADAVPSIMDQYTRARAEMVTDDAQGVQISINAAADSVSRVVLLVSALIERWAVAVERWQRGKWTSAVKSGTGVDLSTLIGPADARQTVEAAIQWNVSLVKDVSDQARNRIANAVWTGLRDGSTPDEVASKLREAVAMGRRRSRNIAADQLSKLHSSLADERRRQAGLAVWEWKHSKKAHPRVEHVERDGHLYSDDPEYVGLQWQGKTIQKVPPTRPGEEPFCGCRSLSCLVFLD